MSEEELPSRSACSTLEDARQLHKTRNYAPLMGLIEELQSYYNRMEAAIQRSRRAGAEAHQYLKEGKTDEAKAALEKRWPKLAEDEETRKGRSRLDYYS